MSEDIDGTVHDKFLMMMNDRIGNMEESIFKLTEMFEDMMIHITDEYISTYMNLPIGIITIIDENFVNKIVTAIEKNKLIIVKKIWVIYTVSRDYLNTSIYLKLKNPIIVKRMSVNINNNIIKALGLTSSYSSNWHETSINTIDNYISDKNLKVIEKEF